MGKTRDLFKKIRDTKGTFYVKMCSIKDRNGMDPTEAEDIKKRWREYTDQIRSVAQSCPTLCNPRNCSTPGLPVHHQLPEFTHTHVHQVSDAIQPSHPLKAMVFPVVMYGCESWTVKRAEHQRIDAFELWCWRRLLRVPWTARRSALGFLWKE